MTQDAIEPDRRLAKISAGALVLAFAFLPLARLLDQDMDRKRPMYNDVFTMDELQFRQVQQIGEPLALSLRSGDTVNVGGRRFTPSKGTTLTVSVSSKGYCIQATNDHGDTTRRLCNDGKTDPSP